MTFFIILSTAMDFAPSNLGYLTCYGMLYLNDISTFILLHFTLDVEPANYQPVILILSYRDMVRLYLDILT
jgi:hypothetical protein